MYAANAQMATIVEKLPMALTVSARRNPPTRAENGVRFTRGDGKHGALDALTLIVRVALSVVFAVAGVMKLRDPVGAQQTVGGVGVPARFRPTVAFLLSVVELASAALLVLPGLGLVGGVCAFVLLFAFLVALSVQHARGVDVPCACFGQIAVTPAGVPTLVRNAVLLAAAGFVILGR